MCWLKYSAKLRTIAGLCCALLLQVSAGAAQMMLSSTANAAADTRANSFVHTVEDAEAIYAARCAACHEQAAGSSLPQSQVPALLEVAQKRPAADMARAVLHGKFDRLEQDGPVMPGHSYMSNEEIAGLVNHLRQLAGVADDTVSVADVARIRGARPPLHTAPLSAAQQRRAEQLYNVHCAACHAVDRGGRSGPSLHQWAMQQMGTASVQATLHFGSSWGMPAWGMDGALTAEDIHLLARYLQQPLTELPEYDFAAVRNSWQYLVTQPDRSAELLSTALELSGDLFVSLLHDSGQIMIIDSRSAKIVAVVDAVIAPHYVVRSANGRYLYVMSRGADIAMIDLYAATPSLVARVKTGYEGRSLAVSEVAQVGTIAVGSYWPPQVAVLNAQTLQPLAVHAVDSNIAAENGPNTEVSQVVAFGGAGEFMAVAKHAGELIRFNERKVNEVRAVAPTFLRAGSWDVTRRYLIVPTDDGQLVIVDSQAEHPVTVLQTPELLGGNRGAAVRDPQLGDMWLATGLGSSKLVRLLTNGKPSDWRLLAEVDAEATGSLTIAAHQNSSNIWFDRPLHPSARMSAGVGVIQNHATDSVMVHHLPILQWAGLSDSGAKVLHPQFNRQGDEVWLTVWNRQDKQSAIVIVDDNTLTLKKVIRDQRLITPIRTYHLAGPHAEPDARPAIN